MPIKYRYILFVGLLHGILAVLAYQLLSERKIWFLLVEGGMLLSVYLAYRLYKRLIEPIDYINNGIGALRDGEIHYRHVWPVPFALEVTPEMLEEGLSLFTFSADILLEAIRR